MPQIEKKVQAIMDRAMKKNLTADDFKEGGSTIQTEPEGEDCLCWMTAEEKECLQFLLETINSLDVEESQEDEVDSSNRTSEKEQTLQGGIEKRDNSVNLRRHPRLDMSQRTSADTTRAVDKTEHQSAASKVKMTKAFSEEFPGLSLISDPTSLKKLSGTHPSHLRKFDTIMRSGVNVQELRARFAAQRAVSDLDASSKATDVSEATQQSVQLSGIVKSPREEALHKLGLSERNQTLPNMTCPPASFLACAPVHQHCAVQSCEAAQGVSKLSGGASGVSQSSGGSDHEQALRKLGLLKF